MTTHVTRRVRSRRGFALLATMWLAVGIAAVALAFARETKETRLTAINVMQLSQARASAQAGLATVQSRLDQLSNNLMANTRYPTDSQDPWRWADSLFSEQVWNDEFRYEVYVRDVGALLDINQATEQTLRTFFTALNISYTQADQLAQAILDWREPGDYPRANGAKRPQYVSAGRAMLPTGHSFAAVEELRYVLGMTPEIFDLIAPYLTVSPVDAGFVQSGNAPIMQQQRPVNVNTAPLAVLRTIPQFSDEVVARILSQRSSGGRFTSLGQLTAQTGLGGGQALQGRVSFNTQQIEILCIGWGTDGRTRVTSTVRVARATPTLSVQWRREG